ncbi:MAG TPA: META domain-containing protein [Anaerolineae bacterium]|nr:META domain-containing protein [Anaerolineae bacterium]
MNLLKICLTILVLLVIVGCAQNAATPSVSLDATPSVSVTAPSGVYLTPTPGNPPGLDTPTPPPAALTSLVNTQWKLVSMGVPGAETPVIHGIEVTMGFGADGKVAGSSGCNQYSTDYKINGNQITFGSIIMTERACENTAVMQQETEFLEALQSSTSFEQTNDHLVIKYNSGQSVMNFVNAIAIAPRIAFKNDKFNPLSRSTRRGAAVSRKT